MPHVQYRLEEHRYQGSRPLPEKTIVEVCEQRGLRRHRNFWLCQKLVSYGNAKIQRRARFQRSTGTLDDRDTSE